MPFAVALSGLNAASSDLSVTANNIANANTTGFKASRAEFADVFAVGAQNIGNGVAMSSVTQEFSQGGVDFTDRGLDLAISGEGFFTMSDRGVVSYTRAGSFGVDRDGYVVNSQEQRLQIFPVASNGTFNTGTLSDLRLATADSPPQATTRAEFGINLPANAAVPSVPMFDPANASSYNHSTAVTIYDSLGASHTSTAYFVKTATANQWEARFYIDGTAVGGANTHDVLEPGRADGARRRRHHAAGVHADERRRADHDDRRRAELDAVRLAVRRQPAQSGRLRLGPAVEHRRRQQRRDLRALHERPLGAARPGRAVELREHARVCASSATRRGARPSRRATPCAARPGTGSFGLIQSGALESSNVDLTEQLVNMITAQRNFQANAQMISTADQVTQTIINIR